MNDFENEKEALKHSVEVSRIMSEVLEHHERENKRLWRAFIVSLICNVIIAACMIWAVTNGQSIANEAISQALDAVAEIGVVSEETTTTTTTTEVTQDTGEGGGNNVYQAGDNTTYNEAGSDDGGAE